MRSLIRRYREPIFVAALVAWTLAIFAAKARKPPELNWLDRALLLLTAPAERAIVATVSAAQDVWGGYVALVHVREQNLRLEGEILRARLATAKQQELKLENDRLRRLLDYADRQPPTRLLTAQVVAVGVSPHSHTLRIARGTDDGVVRGAAVISPDGVVGTVAVATAGYADVQLIVSATAAVPAIAQRTRGRSTVKGTGDVTRCKLEYALRTDELRDGDVLVTAGGAGFFPKGLPIGHVVNLVRKPTGMFLTADVIPAVDFSRLDEVLVVLAEAAAEPRSPATPAASFGGPSERAVALPAARAAGVWP